MGFGRKWIEWRKWCITTTSFFVMINGSPTGFFRRTRGLWQGDPLSPYFFVLGMEVFSILIEKAGGGGFLSGYKLKGRNGEIEQITHLLFSDDTFIFCKDSEEKMTCLCWILF